MSKLIDFFKISAPNPALAAQRSDKNFRNIRLATFISATCGYALYYVCRLSMNIVRKPIVDDGVFTETQLGIIGSCLFFVYAAGKMANGFLADRCNVRRFMSVGLLLTALVNLVLGFTSSFIVFALLWGLNGWFQSMAHRPEWYRSTAGTALRTEAPTTDSGARATISARPSRSSP